MKQIPITKAYQTDILVYSTNKRFTEIYRISRAFGGLECLHTDR